MSPALCQRGAKLHDTNRINGKTKAVIRRVA